MNRVYGTIAACSLALAGCSGQRIDDYQDLSPSFVPEAFFNGALYARGVIRNRSGQVIRTFDADLTGSWQQGVGTLSEIFRFNDGEVQERVWTLEKISEGRYRGSAGDVIGDADILLSGNAMHLRYTLQVPYGDGTINLAMNDWIYMVTEDTVINITEMRKWGFKVGSLHLVIGRKQP